ncbi:MAG: hypothetical protein M3Q37_00990, partial [Gemmatimonadota bacterium]|nr:hypothetical protein [Gemmatimonadota bacterium]
RWSGWGGAGAAQETGEATTTRQRGSDRRLAVLPFENLGDSADAYFADGVTDEIRGKLAALPGLEVIASTSANQYRGTGKRPDQIGRELGARYLLVGRVRWAKTASGVNRVQVRPELIDTRSEAVRWGAPFDAPHTDVFLMQADIAARVAQALGVALGASERERLAARPTQNLAAYDAYLRALEVRRTDAPAAAAGFERAVALDSTFALAWAELSLTRQRFSGGGITPRTHIERSRGDAERAIALQPRLARGYLALANYYLRSGNHTRALAEYARGLAVAPNDVDLLGALVNVDLRRGQWERALEAARRLQSLDPRSGVLLGAEAAALHYLRRFPEAQSVVNRAVTFDSLEPRWYTQMMDNAAAQGDLAAARRAVDLAQRRLGYSQAVAFLGRWYDEQWILPDTTRAFLLRLPPSAMEGDTIDWATTLALAARSLGQRDRAQAYADTARRVLERRQGEYLIVDPLENQLGLGLCLANALAKRVSAARGHCQALVDRPSPNAMWHDFELWAYALASMEIGDPDKAITALEQLVRGPGRFTPAYLRLDPTFASLRTSPRYQRLVSGM